MLVEDLMDVHAQCGRAPTTSTATANHHGQEQDASDPQHHIMQDVITGLATNQITIREATSKAVAAVAIVREG